MDASWRFESPISWLLLDGVLSSTGETKPSASSSSWSKKLRKLKSVFIVMVKSGLTLLSSSEPSSSSCREGQSNLVTEQFTASLLRNRYLFSPHALGNRYGKWIGRASTSVTKAMQDTRRPPVRQPIPKAWQRNCDHQFSLVKETPGNKTEWKNIPEGPSNLLLCLIWCK